MTITLDTAEPTPPNAGHPGPIWRVTCDQQPGCHHRLYLHGRDQAEAAARATELHGWATHGDRIYCRVHREARGG